MKKLLLLFLLVSCSSRKIEVPTNEVLVAVYSVQGHIIREFRIDGCHYFFHYQTSIIHKANCPNHQIKN